MIAGIVAMIVIHEGGHFLAAKAFGMKSTEAFFGFGPKLWSLQAGETEYGIKAIPTLIFFKNGDVVEQITGMVAKSKLEEALNKIT
jgi:membrane-associated protease RseP (regulator of RpoE activity)